LSYPALLSTDAFSPSLYQTPAAPLSAPFQINKKEQFSHQTSRHRIFQADQCSTYKICTSDSHTIVFASKSGFQRNSHGSVVFGEFIEREELFAEFLDSGLGLVRRFLRI
jgi:hypothetical protein